MSCFLHTSSYPSDASLNPLPLTPADPSLDANPAVCHDFAVDAQEHDLYMGIGLHGFKHAVTVKETMSSANKPTNSEGIAGLSGYLEHPLCGVDLKLAPPSSSPDMEEVDDGQSLSGNVGWPPITSYRKTATRLLSMIQSCNERETLETQLLLTTQVSLITNDTQRNQVYGFNHDFLENDTASTQPFQTKPEHPVHIKVSMDGTPIMRKLDLTHMQGYQQLFLELQKLLKFYERSLSCNIRLHSSFTDSKAANFILTYEDKDGDLMLIGNTPWKTFAYSARRIRIMRLVE